MVGSDKQYITQGITGIVLIPTGHLAIQQTNKQTPKQINKQTPHTKTNWSTKKKNKHQNPNNKKKELMEPR